MRITFHGEQRLRKRAGLPKQAVRHNAELALEYGLDHRQARGALQRYLAMLYNRYNGTGNNIRVYNDFVYVFHNEILITVLNVPPEHRKAAMHQQKRRREDEL